MSHGLSQAMRIKMQMRLASSTAAPVSHFQLASEDLDCEDACTNKTLNDLSVSSTQAPSEHPSVFSIDFNVETNKLSIGSSVAHSERPGLGSLDFRETNELSRGSSTHFAERPGLGSLNFREINDLSLGSSQGPPEAPSLRSLEFRDLPHMPLHSPTTCQNLLSSDSGAPEEPSAKGVASLLGATVKAYPTRSFDKQTGIVTSVEGGCLTVEFDNKKFGEITLPEGRSVEVRKKLTNQELALWQAQRAETRRKSRRAAPRQEGSITMVEFFAMCKAQNLTSTGALDDGGSADSQRTGP